MANGSFSDLCKWKEDNQGKGVHLIFPTLTPMIYIYSRQLALPRA